jgi:transposase
MELSVACGTLLRTGCCMRSAVVEDIVAVLAWRFEALEPPPRTPDRHDLSDEEWALVQPLLPAPSATGRKRRDDRQVLDGILYALRTGCQWRDIPDRYGPWKTIHNRFTRWRAEKVVDRIADGLLSILEDRGEIDQDLWCVDATISRAARCAAGALKKGAQTTNRKTMRSVVHEVASARRSTLQRTATESRLASSSRPGRSTTQRRSKR